MWWIWARVVAAGAMTTPAGAGARGAEAAVGPSMAAKAVAADLAATPHGEHAPTRTNADPPPPPPGPTVMLYDEDLLSALDKKQPNFLRCFRIAQKDDLMLVSAHVALHVEVSPTGAVDVAAADGGPPKLDACIEGVAKRMTFDPPQQRVGASLNLFFQ